MVAQGAIRVVVSLEVAIAEAAEEGRLIANLEDLLDILELEATFSHIVLWVKRVIDARHSGRTVHQLY